MVSGISKIQGTDGVTRWLLIHGFDYYAALPRGPHKVLPPVCPFCASNFVEVGKPLKLLI